jgi:hypothetical protein
MPWGERLFRESKEKKDSTIIDNWYDDHRWEYKSVEWDRKELVSNSLLEQADELDLPRPPYSDKSKWEIADESLVEDGAPVLTLETMMDLRSTIRKEQRERRESIDFWLKGAGVGVTILTGLVGALIGLLSLLNHR